LKTLTLFIFAILFYTSCLFANEISKKTIPPKRPIDIDVDFKSDYFETKPWVKEFRYVVVVNKAISGNEAQSVKVYEYGELIISGKVSTGRDQFEAKGEHDAKKDSWSVTPTGFYTPSFLDRFHRSSAYGGKWSWLKGGTKMPFAIFFNGDIALHQAPKGTESALGRNVSGGCIRLPFEIASDLFARIQETEGSRIPLFKVDGTVIDDGGGKYNYRTDAFSALIIVKNKVL